MSVCFSVSTNEWVVSLFHWWWCRFAHARPSQMIGHGQDKQHNSTVENWGSSSVTEVGSSTRFQWFPFFATTNNRIWISRLRCSICSVSNRFLLKQQTSLIYFDLKHWLSTFYYFSAEREKSKAAKISELGPVESLLENLYYEMVLAPFYQDFMKVSLIEINIWHWLFIQVIGRTHKRTCRRNVYIHT